MERWRDGRCLLTKGVMEDAGAGGSRLGGGAMWPACLPGREAWRCPQFTPLLAAQPAGPSAAGWEGHGTTQAPEAVLTPQGPLEPQE